MDITNIHNEQLLRKRITSTLSRYLNYTKHTSVTAYVGIRRENPTWEGGVFESIRKSEQSN